MLIPLEILALFVFLISVLDRELVSLFIIGFLLSSHIELKEKIFCNDLGNYLIVNKIADQPPSDNLIDSSRQLFYTMEKQQLDRCHFRSTDNISSIDRDMGK